MKQLIVSLTILFSLKGYTQNNADAIIGTWLKIPKEDLIVEVFRSGNEYKGRITWTKDTANKKSLGFIILEKLQYQSRDKTWTNGKIHDPKSGKTYDAETRIRADGTLEVHAYKAIKFFGTKKYFKRAE